jgi:FkbM family methyltransferase
MLRIKKLFCSARHPVCWKPLLMGVAPSVEHHRSLSGLLIDGVIDVGANRGQFALECRLVLPKIPIVSFEPIPTAAAIFRKVHGGSGTVELIETALGETTGTATLHLSKSADSSSLLPIGERQRSLFRNTEEVGTLSVPLQCLDHYRDRWTGRNRQLLKLDVQGCELNVLRGSTETLKLCQFVYAECSEVELYEGQALRPEVTAFLLQHGFVEKGHFNSQFEGTQLIQADYLFEKCVR